MLQVRIQQIEIALISIEKKGFAFKLQLVKYFYDTAKLAMEKYCF